MLASVADYDFHFDCLSPNQQPWNIDPILFYCWPSVYDAGAALRQHCIMFAGRRGAPANNIVSHTAKIGETFYMFAGDAITFKC